MKGSLPCWKAIIKDILLLLVGRLSALSSFTSRDFRMTDEMVQRAAMAISCLSIQSWLMADLCWLYTASPIKRVSNGWGNLNCSSLLGRLCSPSMGNLEASLGILFPFESGIAQWMQRVVFSALSSAILWEFSAVSLSIRMDCSGSASCCSALAADALFHAKMLIFLAPQSPKPPCLWGSCPPRPAQAQRGDLLHVLWVHHEPATSSVPSQKNLLLSFHLYFFKLVQGYSVGWLARRQLHQHSP